MFSQKTIEEEEISFDEISVLLMENLEQVQKCQISRDQANKDVDRDWGYFGREYKENLKKAQNEFSETLKKAIDARITHLLMNSTLNK